MLAQMWRPSSDPLHRLAWRPDHGPLDVRWRIVGALDGRYTDGQRAVPLRGGSLGLAVCGYLARILGCEWTEPNGSADWTGTGVIAEVGTESNPTRFADVADGTLERKVRACFARRRVRRFYVTSRQSGLAENFAANLDHAEPLWPLVGEADVLTSLLTAVRRHSALVSRRALRTERRLVVRCERNQLLLHGVREHALRSAGVWYGTQTLRRPRPSDRGVS